MVPHTANTHTHTHTPGLVTSRFGAPSFKTFDGNGRGLETVAVEDKAITYSIAAMNVLHNMPVQISMVDTHIPGRAVLSSCNTLPSSDNVRYRFSAFSSCLIVRVLSPSLRTG